MPKREWCPYCQTELPTLFGEPLKLTEPPMAPRKPRMVSEKLLYCLLDFVANVAADQALPWKTKQAAGRLVQVLDVEIHNPNRNDEWGKGIYERDE